MKHFKHAEFSTFQNQMFISTMVSGDVAPLHDFHKFRRLKV